MRVDLLARVLNPFLIREQIVDEVSDPKHTEFLFFQELFVVELILACLDLTRVVQNLCETRPTPGGQRLLGITKGSQVGGAQEFARLRDDPRTASIFP